MHETIKQVTEDIEGLRYNTAIARLMEYLNAIKKANAREKVFIETLALLLGPFAPHIAEELWEELGHQESIFTAKWPGFDEEKMKKETITLVLQVNGKVRSTVTVPINSDDEALKAAALADGNVKRHLDSKQIVKVIVVKNKLVNVVVR
jgi:leucyl-tRNA synthetase